VGKMRYFKQKNDPDIPLLYTKPGSRGGAETMAKPLEIGLELTGEDALRFHRYMEGHEELPQRGHEMMRVAIRLAEKEQL